MKPVFDYNMQSRIKAAAAMENPVAKKLLKAVSEGRFHGRSNNFAMTSSSDQQITCTRHSTNFLAQNKNTDMSGISRQICSLGTFLSFFDIESSDETTDLDIEYFGEMLKVGKKLHCVLGKTEEDFAHAYLEINYCEKPYSHCSSLHSSCMRHPGNMSYLPRFYATVAGAQILMLLDDKDKVYARAVVWPRLKCVRREDHKPYGEFSLLDRVYTTYGFTSHLMLKEAEKLGIMLRKQSQVKDCNTYVKMNPIPEKCAVLGDVVSDHLLFYSKLQNLNKYTGSPWLDTMCYFGSVPEEQSLCLLSLNGSSPDWQDYEVYGQGYTTEGAIHTFGNQCIFCGQHTFYRGSDSCMCRSCEEKHFQHGLFGLEAKCNTVKTEFGSLPEPLTEDGVLRKYVQFRCMLGNY